MLRRRLVRTDLQVSELGFGAARGCDEEVIIETKCGHGGGQGVGGG